MESANESARRAVNGLLDRLGCEDVRCKLWPLTEVPFTAFFRFLDAERLAKGLPNWFLGQQPGVQTRDEVSDVEAAPAATLVDAMV